MENDLDETTQQRVKHINNVIPFIKKAHMESEVRNQALSDESDTDQLQKLQTLIDMMKVKSLKLKLIQLKLMQLEIENKINE